MKHFTDRIPSEAAFSDGEPDGKPEAGPPLLRPVLLAGMAVLFVLLFRTVTVVSSSMYPTLRVGDYCIALPVREKTALQRGDILCFSPYTEENGCLDTAEEERTDLYVKRLLGLPGDRLRMEDGTVYINGRAQTEPYLATGADGDMPELTVPEGCVFFLGDNRNFSADSRVLGAIPLENIRLKVLVHFPTLATLLIDLSTGS